MKTDLCRQVYETILRDQMLDLQKKTNILIGISGGADSVCLLLALHALQKAGKIPCTLRAVHVHHGLRAAADEDEAFVRGICWKYGIPLEVYHVNAAAFAGSQGMGTEEAGHILRRRIFAQSCRNWQKESVGESASDAQGDEAAVPCVIALAHHREDLVETQLFHLARGCEIQGLAGIQPVTELVLPTDMHDLTNMFGSTDMYGSARMHDAGKPEFFKIIHPLLACTRVQIEAYLNAMNVAWRIDESNADLTYARNLIRHNILPALEQVNANALSHFARLADTAMDTERYLAQQTDLAWNRCAAAAGQPAAKPEEAMPPCSIHVGHLLGEDPLIQRRLLYRMVITCTGRKKDITREHIESLLALAQKEGNGQLDLPYHLRVTKQYSWLIPDMAKIPAAVFPYPFSRASYQMTMFPYRHNSEAIPRNKYTKWFDYDKIAAPVVFRTRQQGDYMTIGTDGRKKFLTRYMIDSKIPAAVRDKMVLPFAGQEALWIPGGRISARYPVDDTTRTILELHLMQY